MDARAVRTWFDLVEWSPAAHSWPQQRKEIWAWRKLKKARRWVRVLRFVPSIRMIAIGNTLGYGNCSDESDIDFVIVTAPRRIWFVRLCVVALLRLFRQRPGEHTRDAICPSFFLTTEAMNLEDLQLLPHSSSRAERAGGERSREISHQVPRDPYLLWWVTQLTVLFDRGGTYDAFWRANEQWVRRWLPDAQPRAVHPRIFVGAPPPHAPPPRAKRDPESPRDKRGSSLPRPARRPAPAHASEERGWGVGDALERWCRRFQERRFSSEVRALANRDSRVVLTDRMLKFHTNDRRQEYRDRWIERLRA
ncbi:MAG: hypothetical protein Q7R80_03355 [bacterium]|nr:hypothetical protein [bacterium]